MYTEFLSENLKERAYLGDLGIDGTTLLQYICRK